VESEDWCQGPKRYCAELHCAIWSSLTLEAGGVSTGSIKFTPDSQDGTKKRETKKASIFIDLIGNYFHVEIIFLICWVK
jgi:hypothetical protein